MAEITLGGNPATTTGTIPQKGDKLPDFKLVDIDLNAKTLADYKGKKILMSIFPSVGTGVCAASLRKFNEIASSLDNTVVLNVSKDLPFAQKGFCAAEGLENVIMLSDFRYNSFDDNYHVLILNGGFEGLLSRAVIIADENGVVQYSEQVPAIGQEPNYDEALKHL